MAPKANRCLNIKPVCLMHERMAKRIAKQVRGADGSIKTSTPAEMLGWGPRPGGERSGTPGKEARIEVSPRSGRQPCDSILFAEYLSTINGPYLISYRPLRGLGPIFRSCPGAYAPGFMPPSAPRTGSGRRLMRLGCDCPISAVRRNNAH